MKEQGQVPGRPASGNKDTVHSFWDYWQSKQVRVRCQPFQGWVGQVISTFRPRVQVVFPLGEGRLYEMWLHADDVEALETVEVP